MLVLSAMPTMFIYYIKYVFVHHTFNEMHNNTTSSRDASGPESYKKSRDIP